MLWILLSLLLAAAMAPWLYGAGKNLAAAAEVRELPALLEWLGAACGRADISRYYSRALVICALLLLPGLCWRVRALSGERGWRGQVSFSWQEATGQVVLGCLVAGGMLWGLGLVLESFGTYALKAHPPGLRKLVVAVMVPAVVVSLLEEWLFREVLLGYWVKFTRPFFACLWTSFLFGLLHFIKLPEGAVIAEPTACWAGFELLGKALGRLADPLFFLTDFSTLFVIGMILGYARLRTGGLWFPIGLHAGWVMAFKGFGMLHHSKRGYHLRPWGLGESLRSGLLPLAALCLTALICHGMMGWWEGRKKLI